jgi:hypothetical protein
MSEEASNIRLSQLQYTQCKHNKYIKVKIYQPNGNKHNDATDEHITKVKLQTALSENNCDRLSTYSHTQTSRPRVTREIN